MKTYTINSTEDIKEFFQSLYTDYNLLLDLDLPFADYTTEENVPCFDKEQAEYLDKIMVECFEWCEANKLDVHEIGFDVQVAEFKNVASTPQILNLKQHNFFLQYLNIKQSLYEKVFLINRNRYDIRLGLYKARYFPKP